MATEENACTKLHAGGDPGQIRIGLLRFEVWHESMIMSSFDETANGIKSYLSRFVVLLQLVTYEFFKIFLPQRKKVEG